MRAAAEKKKKQEDEERDRLATAEKDKAAKAEAEKVEAARIAKEEQEKGAAGAGLGGLESKGAEFGIWVEKMKVGSASHACLPGVCAEDTRDVGRSPRQPC